MDLTKFIVPTTLDNTNENGCELPSFRTTDLVFLDSFKDVENEPKEMRRVLPTDYAVMNNVAMIREWGCTYYLRSADVRSAGQKPEICVMWADGSLGCCRPTSLFVSICPAMHLDVKAVIAERLMSPKAFGISKSGHRGYRTLEFGEYPKTFVGKKKNVELEALFDEGKLVATGKCYSGTTLHPEYSYNGQRYVRVRSQSYDIDCGCSDGTRVADGTYLWMRVEPIVWKIRNWEELPKQINPYGSGEATFIDVRTEEAIVAGIQFHRSDNKDGALWQNSTIRGYLNGINVNNIKTNGNPMYAAQYGGDFSVGNSFLTEALNVELEAAKQVENVVAAGAERTPETRDEPIVRRSRLEKLNPDNVPKERRRRMTDTEVIKTWIDAGQSVLLRGPSGIGKTERIKTLYPNLIYIKLTNNMFPEKVVGSMNLQTGQSIPPDFAKQAILACANEEERKLIEENIQNLYEIADEIYERSKNSTEKVVILLDELLNVKPAVQSLVYTLVLNKIVETGKGLKLPANAVVVATGNQKKYSQVAEDLAEPLEKRFDHILDMEPKVSEWIYEYAIPKKLHPSVIGYIFSKYQETAGKARFGKNSTENIGYFYEEPEVGEEHLDKNGCRGRTNDPRGWTSLSNALYALEEDLRAGKFVGRDVESLFKTTIDSKLRVEWAEDFFDFYNHPTLSVEEVVERSYDKFDLPKDVNEKFAYIAALMTADMEQVGACREFIRKYCDPEYLSVYDLYWAGDDEDRMEKIVELQEISAISSKAPKDSRGGDGR